MLPETIDTIWRSIWISGISTVLASSWSIPIAYYLSTKRRILVLESVLESLVGMPTVLLGLLLYMLFSSSGPLGMLRLLYTPVAIVIGQSILITPLIITIIYRSARNRIRELRELGLSLGISKYRLVELYVRDTSPVIVASFIIGFSRALGELGVAMMLGGNIRGYTRVVTTAIALNVSQGRYEESVVLGLALLLIVIVVSIAFRSLSRVYEK